MLDFVVVGPQRTGSTWLDASLRHHPQLCLPKGIKETMYFDRRTHFGRERYARYFAHCGEGRLKGEVSPSYFHVPEAARRLQAEAPEAKIVIVLRDPTEKTYSLFLHHLSKGRVPRDLRQATRRMPELVNSARYARWVPMWWELFGRERVHLMPFADVAEQPQAALGELCAFLGVPAGEAVRPESGRRNAASSPRFPWLASLAARSVTRLHDLGLHRVVAWGKRLGLNRVYAGGEADMPRLSPEERAYLDELFAEDRAFLERVAPSGPGGGA